MIRYSASSKLFKYTTEEKKRYKLYKKKTMWVVAGISLFSTASFVQHVSADETQETTTLVQTDTDVTQKVETDAQTDVATNEMVSQETDTVDVENKTSEVSLETSTAKTQDTSEVSQTQVFASETNTTADSAKENDSVLGATEGILDEKNVQEQNKVADTPVQTNNQQNQIEEQVALEQETTLGKTNRENINGSLSTESAQAEVADTTGRTASVTAINQGDTTATLSAPKILADGSTEYTLTPSNLANGAGKLGLTISYTGQKGDTFSMVVSPKDFVGESRDIGDSMAPTGSPKKTRKDGNVTVFTWTMNDIADNVTATKTQTIPAVSFFWEDPLKSYEAYPPYMVGADTRATMLRGGEKIEIKFLVNGQEAPSSTTTSIVLEKAIKIADINVTNIVNSNNNKRTTDENYTYKVVLKYEKNIRMQGYFKLNIPVPEHFLLDEQATKDFLKNNANNGAYVNGEFKVTQPNGEGTPIIIESQALPYMFFGQSDQGIYFVGRYTSTQTTGASEKPSGWYDLGNGEKHYFGAINIDTGEALDSGVALNSGKIFNEIVIARDSTSIIGGVTVPDAHEDFNITISYSSDNQNNMHLTSVESGGYDVIKSQVTSNSQEIQRRLPTSENGFSAGPLLYDVGLNATGLTSFTPTYHFDFPDEITTTGVVMPINNVSDDYADFGSYNPAQTGYTVIVTGADGSKITQRLRAGESYNPTTGLIDHFGSFSVGEKLAEGVKIAAYDITPDVPYFANARQGSRSDRSSGRNSINDITTGYINVLGYLNTKAQAGKDPSGNDYTYVSHIIVESEYKKVQATMAIQKIDELKLPFAMHNSPYSGGYGNNQATINTDETYIIGFRATASKPSVVNGINLDAGGILEGKPNNTATDRVGMAWPVEYKTIKDPIIYLTVPDQMDLTKYPGSNTFYMISPNSRRVEVPDPKITQKTNAYGQTVMVLDWTGTGYEIEPGDAIDFAFKVRSDAVGSFDTDRTLHTQYAYEDKANGKTLDLYTADQLKAMGVSTEGLRAYAPNITSDNNTSWIQLGGDFSNSTISPNNKGKLKFDDGTTVDTLMIEAGNDRGYIRIITATEVKTATMIKGTADIGISSAGLNYPTKDFIEVNGNKVGLQTLQFGIVNNTSDKLTGVISVMNLPQAGVADSNNPSAKQDFTLNISSAGVLTNETTNNYAQNAHTMYYSEQLLTLSSDGKTITFADGSTWTRGQAIPSQLKTADQVTDWSTIKSLMLYIPSLTEQDKIVYRFDTYSPTSEANMSKSVTLRQVSGYDDQLSVIIGTITDSYATYATLRIVDQDGNQINGYKDVQGKAILDETTGKYTVENADLIGKAGERLILEPAGAITGYKFVGNKYEPNELLLADGSTLIIRTYQVDTASLFEGSLAGTKLATATGDPQANTGSNFKEDPTGTNDIDFEITDAQLTRKGYSYTITVVDRNDKTLVDKDGRSRYDTLAQAVAAHKKFDSASDTAGSTQNFIVNYVGDFQKVVIISKDDPAKLLPTTITEAENKAPFYNDGVSGGVMFYDENNTPIISDETTLDDGTSAFKRPNYRYTVIAPDGKEYSSLDEALAAKLTFDNTDNDGNTDKDIQIYEIKYVEDLQTLRVTVIDDQGTETRPVTLIDGQELGVGLSNSEITSSVKSEYENIIARYIAAGYVVVSQDVMPNNYDSDPNVDQMLVIHLRHVTEEVAGASVTLTEKINYVYGGGVHKGEKVRDAYVSDPITFNAVDTIDKVTKKLINTVWSSAQILGEVQSPLVSGYTALPAKIESITVTHETPKEELEFTVQYVPDQQVINYQVIDDTDNKELVPVTVLGSGESESNVLLSTYQHYQAIVDEYEKQGYVIESMSEFPDKYDSDSTVDQLVVIHLSHGRLEEAGETKTVKQTVSYIYGNGPKQGEKASETIEKEYIFTSRNTLDAVTREVLSTIWSDPQTTDEVTSPTIDGYVADKQSITSQSLTHESENLVDVVTYTAGIQTVKIHYVDVYGVDKGTGYTPTSGTELVAQLQTLTGDAEKTYTNTLWNFEQLGYELVEAQPEAIQGVFDADPSVEQNYYVYLTHTINDVEGTPVTVTRVVNYIYASGPKTGQVAADSVSEVKTFVPTYKVDQVTKQNVGEPTWSPESDVYSEVTSPMISGYTADIASVSAETITPTSQNSTVTVRYTANEQVLTYTVIDDGDSGKLLENQVALATGETSSIVGASILQNYLDIINGYVGKGYVVVSQDSLPANFDDNDAVDQNVVIRLDHGRLEEAGETKTVKQTISYVYGNGPKQGEEASKTIEKEYVFTSKNTLDAVTKEVLSTVWSDLQTTPEIISPTIDGYVADKQSIASQNLTHESENLVDVVTYTAGIQTVKIHYVDVYGVDKGTGYTPTSGVELTDQLPTLTGDAEKAYTNTLWNYGQLGYELVEAQPEAIQGVFDDDPSVEQNYYVYLTHTINDVEGTPVTVTRVVNYIYASGPKTGQVAADSVSEVKTFVPTYKVDQVTKQNVGAPTWTPASDILAEVTSPTISGYTADIATVSAETITPTSQNSTITVRYTANEQVLTYTVIDDGDSGKLLEDQVTLATGETSSIVGASVLQDYQNIINGYISKGYVVVSQDSLPANFDDSDAVDQNVVIHLEHGEKPVGPNDPHIPNTPVNPKDPDGPKWPTSDQYSKKYTSTITYVDDKGNKLTEDVVQTSIWTRTLLIDTVTGAIKNPDEAWTADRAQYSSVDSPLIKGYYVDKVMVASKDSIQDNLYEQVTYRALGKIVPVDPDGNPIPNVPNPQYPNDPTDPSKVISEQPVPNIPDMTPEVPTITPKDPGEDTKVVYNYDIQTAVINYIDETTGKQIASDSVTGRNNAKIEYTTADKLNELTNKGYVLVSDDFNTDAVFDNDKSVDQVFNVILQHGRVEEAGETKTIKQTINYVFGDGPKKGTPVAEMYQKEYVFTSRNTLDAVTREVLATVWSQSQSTKEVVSPKIKGYVADKALISKSDIEHTSSDLNDTVSYYAGKQIVTIHYIDVNGVKESETGYTPSDGKEIIDFIQRLSGEAGISYSNKLQDYVAKGYELVYAQPEAIEGVFDEDEADKQDYYVYLAHGTNKITGSPVIITDTVNYVYGNGPHKGENVFPPSVIEKMFIPTYVVDKVTGDILETTWTGDGTIEQSLVPVLEGYTADKTVIATRTLTPDMENQAQTVYYYVVETLPKEEQPSIPITPEVETKAPEVSQDVQEKPKQVTTISQKQMPAHAQEQVPEQEQKFADELPQTGDQDDKESMLLGLGLLSGALLGVAELQKKKKKTDK